MGLAPSVELGNCPYGTWGQKRLRSEMVFDLALGARGLVSALSAVSAFYIMNHKWKQHHWGGWKQSRQNLALCLENT